MTLLSFVRNLEGKIQISLFQGAERIQNSISWDALKAYTPPKAASEKKIAEYTILYVILKRISTIYRPSNQLSNLNSVEQLLYQSRRNITNVSVLWKILLETNIK